MKILHEFAESFYSRLFYSRLCFDGKGIGMRFILLITFINMLFGVQGLYHSFPNWHEAMDSFQEKIDTFPAMSFKDGTLTIDRPSPYLVKFGTHYVMFNMNYQVGDVAALTKYMTDNSIAALLTADKKIVLSGTGKLEIDDWKALNSVTISHDTWHTIGGAGVHWLIGFIIIGSFLYMFIANILAALIVGAIMMVVGLAVGARFPGVGSAVRVAAAMRIPAKLINTEPGLLGIIPAGTPWGTFTWLVWLGYFFFAVWACRKAYQYTTGGNP